MTTVTERRIVREATNTTMTTTSSTSDNTLAMANCAPNALCSPAATANPTAKLPKISNSNPTTTTPQQPTTSAFNCTNSAIPITTTTSAITTVASIAAAAAVAGVVYSKGDETAATHPGIDRSAYLTASMPEPVPPVPAKMSTAEKISGILKGGKLWKSENSQQVRTGNNVPIISIVI